MNYLFAEIAPADVYQRVLHVESAVGVMMYMVALACVLVMLQVVLKLVIFSRVNGVLTRVERILKINETHSQLSDDRHDLVARKIEAVKREVKDEVVKVPEKTAEKLKDVIPLPPKPPDDPKPYLSFWPFATALALSAAGVSGAAVYRSEATMSDPTPDRSGFSPETVALLDAGYSLMKSGEYADAYEVFGRARDAGALPEETLGRQAECLIYTNRYAAAFEVIDALAKDHPDSSAPHHLRGIAYERQKKLTQAVAAYEAGSKCGNRFCVGRLKKLRVRT